MSASSSPAVAEPTINGGLSLIDRAIVLLAWGLAGTLFLTVGWVALEPDDPLGPVSVYSRQGDLSMLLEAALLAAVSAALATVMAGRRLADVGTFAAAAGLAAVSLRGATAEYFLMLPGGPGERAIAARFAVEAIGWILVLLIALMTSAVVSRWCFGPAVPAEEVRGREELRLVHPVPAGYDVAGLAQRWLGVPAWVQTPVAQGLQHLLLVVVIGLVATFLLSVGLRFRVIRAGQVCFVVAASVALGTYFATMIRPVRSAVWAVLGACALAVVGYIAAVVSPGVPGLPPSIPSSHFVRALPIQFVSVGAASAIGTFWYVYIPTAYPEEPQRGKR